jgi:hypothetical protein
MRVASLIAILASAPGCVSAVSPVSPHSGDLTAKADLPSVFRKTVELPQAIIQQDAPLALEAKEFAKDSLPRYPCRKPVVGDYALYFVNRTREDTSTGKAVWQTQAYLLLEVVTETREDHYTACNIHVYGAVFCTDGSLTHKEWGFADSPHRYGGNARWPGLWLSSSDGSHLTIDVLDYFHKYSRPGNNEEPVGQGAGFQQLPKHEQWGTRYRLDYHFLDREDVSGGAEYFIVSDAVPVRGVMFGFQRWASSSGKRNHEETIELLNHGRLSPTEREILWKAQDPLPSEMKLWESLRWTGPRSKG